MAWQVKRTRKDGIRSIRVAWHDKNLKKPQSETFLASQKRAADAFLRDVEAAGNRWPEGWVPGEGYPPPSLPMSTWPRLLHTSEYSFIQVSARLSFRERPWKSRF